MRPAGPVSYRPGSGADLAACLAVWRASVDDYQRRVNQPPLPQETGLMRRHLAHMAATDPDRFWVAETPVGGPGSPGGGSGLAGFSLATVRGGLWYLAMLFVTPDAQGRGIGSALLDRAQAGRDTPPGGPALPGPDDPLDSGIGTWGMATDSAQPISNALYARRGMLPRLPIWRLAGEPRRWSALPPLPASLESATFDAVAGDGREDASLLTDAVDAVDREVIGVTRPLDHEFLRREGRTGFLVRERHGRILGYGYGAASGRIGPVATLDPDLLPAILGVVVRETPMLDAIGAWVPGTADGAIRSLLEAGLQFDRFPGVLCWSRPETPFARYLPINLAMV